MDDLRAAEAWCILLIFWGLWAPSQGLLESGGLLGSGSKARGDGASGKDGLLSSGLGGRDGLLGPGSGSTPLAAGGLLDSTTGALLGNGSPAGKGGLLGEEGLLGEKGLVAGSLLGQDGLLGGNKSLQGLLGGNLLGLEGLLKESGNSKEPFKWWEALNLEIIRGSWKVVHGAELLLSLQARVIMNFPGSLKFLSGSSVEMNVTAHLAVVQDQPGELRLPAHKPRESWDQCSHSDPPAYDASSFTKFPVALRDITAGQVLGHFLPKICPVFQIWFSLVNKQLQILNDNVFFGLLRKIHTALSSLPVSTGQFSEISFKDKPFPGAFLQWLLKLADPVTSQKSS